MKKSDSLWQRLLALDEVSRENPLDQQLIDLFPVIDRGIIGRVDMARRNPAINQNVPFDAELGTDISELFFDFVHDFVPSFYIQLGE